MAFLRVRCTSAVALIGPTPLPLPLSPFDAVFVPLRPVLHVYLFPSPAPSSSFPALAASLKRSLARTLPSFHPFAGDLTYSPSSHSIAIAYPEAPSVKFIEAETDLNIEELVGADELDTEALRLLVPDIQREALPAPVMAVQVTKVAGGVALGTALHHAVVDGTGLYRFMQSWSAAAAGSSGSHSKSSLPLHDRNLVRFKGDEEFYRAVLRFFAPNLPSIAVPEPTSSHEQQPCRLVRQTFVFTSAAINHLRRQHVIPANAGDQTKPSTFAAIAAHGWLAFSRAGGFDERTVVYVGFFLDIREVLIPHSVNYAAYVGNCVSFCKVGLKVSELAAPDGFVRALSAIMEAMKKVKEDPLGNKEEAFFDNPWDRMFLFSGSPRFPAYEVDLGFGRPARVERACLGGKSEACLTAGKEPGSVQAMVSMAAEKMPVFRQMFMLDGIHGRL